jgi:hypothetical protein
VPAAGECNEIVVMDALSGFFHKSFDRIPCLSRLYEPIAPKANRIIGLGYKRKMMTKIKSTRIWRLIIPFIVTLILGMCATVVQAECTGCLCPGNPCKLCSLPPTKNIPPAPDEADTCLRIREKVSPVSRNTEPNEHYASLNNSMRECVRNGGDVIVNSRRNKEFPSKHYCKPYFTSVSPKKN